MPKRNYIIIFIVILILGLLYFLRVYRLSELSLYDYDSSRNFEIIQEIARGDFSHFFHHNSPTFYLFYLPFWVIQPHFLFLEYLSAGINLFNLVLLTLFIHRQSPKWKQKPQLLMIFLLYAGTSLYLINAARYLSIESLGDLSFLLTFIFYSKSYPRRPLYFYRAALFFGLFFTINYKAVLFLPIFILMEVLQKQRRFPLGLWVRAFALGLFPLFFCVLIGFLFGQAIWKYPAHIFLSWTATSSGEMGSQFGNDPFYYFKFFFHFENPLLFPGLGLYLVYQGKKIFLNLQKGEFRAQMFFLCLCYFGGMSLLLKAPRGLSFIYPFLYYLSFLGWEGLARKKTSRQYIFYFALALSLGFQVYRLKQSIFPYLESQYSEVAHHLKEKKIDKIILTVGRQITPFLEGEIQYEVVFDEKEIPALYEQGYQYVLLDQYYLLTDLKNFGHLEKMKPAVKWKEKSLLAPLLHLEHSEFTRFSFEESLNQRDRLARYEHQLFLIRLDEKTSQKILDP